MCPSRSQSHWGDQATEKSKNNVQLQLCLRLSVVQRACQELTSDRSVSVAAIRAGRFFKRVLCFLKFYMFTVLFVIQVLYHMLRRRLLPVTLLLVSAVEVSFTSNLTSSNAESNGISSMADWTLTREAILSCRPAAPRLDLNTRLNITALGCSGRRRGRRAGWPRQVTTHRSEISVVIGNRPKSKLKLPVTDRQTVLITISRQPRASNDDSKRNDREQLAGSVSPSLYVFNAAALTKPHAVQHLAADLTSYGTDVAVITETHMKSKHTDSVMSVPGYTLSRRDRPRRRGGGVCLYVRSTMPSTVWTYSADDRTYKLLWMRVGGLFIGALYHPSRPQYTTDSLLDYIEACVDELNSQYTAAPIVIAGDFNQLPDHAVTERTGLS